MPVENLCNKYQVNLHIKTKNLLEKWGLRQVDVDYFAHHSYNVNA